jgi:hypothetical protein
MSGDDLMALGMWQDWQATVAAAGPQYARSPIYVNQDVAWADVEPLVAGFGTPYDPAGMARDVAHGATAFETTRGTVTRQWVDGNVEIDFLARHLGDLSSLDVLDIGAGYGRLAVMLGPLVRSYTCVDPVPVSVAVCRDYTGRYAPQVRVLDVAAFLAEAPRPSLALNIHSWNECTRAQVDRWLEALDTAAVPQLFTVVHGCDPDRYETWDGLDFKSLLEARYTVVAEEMLGLGSAGVSYTSPHVLWRRR